MSMNIPIPSGVYDILPIESKELWRQSNIWQHVEKVMREVAHLFGFKEIRTPIFERTELFLRGVGQATDVVTKEMYTFQDRGGRSLTLRPEGTTAVMRAFITNQLQNLGGVHRFYYLGPMFRYERPQAGRYRQHHQFGVEVIGNESPEQDAEVIACLYEVYRRLGLKNLRPFINSLGNLQSREHYRQALKDYLTPYFSSLSPESQVRFEKNPLRILDSKDARDKEILLEAPSILSLLDSDSLKHFEQVQQSLSSLNVPYEVNSQLVRGLDYYNRTVFEIAAADLGAQNTIGGGGRFDGLLSSLGGPNLPTVGFGTGIERVIQTLIQQQIELPPSPSPLLYFIPLGDAAKAFCFEQVHRLRQNNLYVEMDLGNKKLKSAMQRANALGCQFVSVIGDLELALLQQVDKAGKLADTAHLQLKKMSDGSIISLHLSELSTFLHSS